MAWGCGFGADLVQALDMSCLTPASCAQEAKWRILASHRSGETEDTFLADITVGLACGQLKSGALARCEVLFHAQVALLLLHRLGLTAQSCACECPSDSLARRWSAAA